MKIKHFFNLFLILLLLIGFTPQVTVFADDKSELKLPNFPKIASQNIVVMDADSGDVLYSNNADKKCYPASTTKLLTALLTVEYCSLSDTVTYSKAAVNSISAGDANAAISVGEKLTVEQSLYALILRSANEVAYGLSEHVSGTMSSFANLMNSKVAELGATNTHFSNPSGLTDEFHYTTPYDMALIAKACFDNKTLMKIISSSDVYTIPPTNKSKFTRYYSHRYQMLPGGDYAYQYSLGGKTGYTDAAGNCLVSFARKDDLRLICVIFNSTDADRYTDTMMLFDYYFNNYKKISLANFDSGLRTGTLDFMNMLGNIDSTTKLSIGFEDGAYLLVPNAVNPDELTSIVTYSDNIAYAGKEGGFACISFFYKNIGVGNSTIYVHDTTTGHGLPGSHGVSTVNYTVSARATQRVHYINFMYIVFAVLGIAFIAIIIIILLKRRRKPHYGSKKLRF